MVPVSAAPRLLGLDGLRGLAAIAVVTSASLSTTWAVGTIPGQVVSLLSFVGIATFAMISASLLGRTWAAQHTDNSDPDPDPDPDRGPWSRSTSSTIFGFSWLARRFWRIAPSFWLASVVYLWTTLIFRADPVATAGRVTVPTFVHLYTDRQWPPGTVLWWAVSVQLAMFVLLALSSERVRRRGPGVAVRIDFQRPGHVAAVVAVFVALALSWRLFVGGHGSAYHLQDWPPAYLDWAAFGVAAGIAKARVDDGAWSLPRWVRDFADHPVFAWVTALGVLLVTAQGRYGSAAVPIRSAQRELRHYGVIVTVALMLLPALFALPNAKRGAWLQGSTLKLAGTLSLGVFLWHSGAVELVERQVREGNLPENPFLRVALALLASAALAAVSAAIIERPTARILANRNPKR